MDIFIQQLINGVTLGSVYALVALGYTMVYGIIGLINFAHGDVVMIGAMAATTVAISLVGGDPGVSAFVVLGMGLLVSWTTNVAEIAPAVSTLGRPLRWLRLPVDDWAATVALSLRAFPMLIDEFRILYAARRLRPRELPDGRRERMKAQVSDLIDLLAATVTVSLRRADEMGDAITARGGAGQLSAHPSRLHTADVVALIVLALVCGVAGYIEGFTFLATT